MRTKLYKHNDTVLHTTVEFQKPEHRKCVLSGWFCWVSFTEHHSFHMMLVTCIASLVLIPHVHAEPRLPSKYFGLSPQSTATMRICWRKTLHRWVWKPMTGQGNSQFLWLGRLALAHWSLLMSQTACPVPPCLHTSKSISGLAGHHHKTTLSGWRTYLSWPALNMSEIWIFEKHFENYIKSLNKKATIITLWSLWICSNTCKSNFNKNFQYKIIKFMCWWTIVSCCGAKEWLLLLMMALEWCPYHWEVSSLAGFVS